MSNESVLLVSRAHCRQRLRLLKRGGTLEQFEELPTAMSLYRPTLIGSMSEKMIDLLWDYTEHNPNWLLHESDPAKLAARGEHDRKLVRSQCLNL